MIWWGGGWGAYYTELESHSQEVLLDTVGQIVQVYCTRAGWQSFPVLVCCPIVIFIVSCFVNFI